MEEAVPDICTEAMRLATDNQVLFLKRSDFAETYPIKSSRRNPKKEQLDKSPRLSKLRKQSCANVLGESRASVIIRVDKKTRQIELVDATSVLNAPRNLTHIPLRTPMTGRQASTAQSRRAQDVASAGFPNEKMRRHRAGQRISFYATFAAAASPPWNPYCIVLVMDILGGVTELTSRWDSDAQYVLIDTHGLGRTRDQKKYRVKPRVQRELDDASLTSIEWETRSRPYSSTVVVSYLCVPA